MNDKLDVICFGGGDWWYHNRAHIDMQIMRRFAKMGTLLYVNSVVIQKPKFTKSLPSKIIRKLKSIFTGLKKSDEGFWVYSPFTIPIHHIPAARKLNKICLTWQIKSVAKRLGIKNPLIWVACPGACDTALSLSRSRLVAQRTDRWEEFPNVDYDVIKDYELRLKQQADLTVFASDILYQQEKHQCKNACYLDHGVDFDLFSLATRNNQTPEDLAEIPKPIAGFFGGIDNHTFDLEFYQKVVDLLPGISFVIIGKPSIDITTLKSKPNVKFLGQKPYEQIPTYGNCFDVALMPWRQNSWIEACNPIKLKEYLALGKPVVSTPFPQLQKYNGLIHVADTPEKFAQSINQAIISDSDSKAEQRKKAVQSSTWDSKANHVLQLLYCEKSENLAIAK